MKISISVGGRFHAFNLANLLQKNNMLDTLITSYPKYEVQKYGITKEKVKSVIIKELFERGYKKVFKKFPYEHINMEIYDLLAARKIPLDSNAYILWSSFGYTTIQRIRKANKSAKIIIERGSAHILCQNELLIKLDSRLAIHPSIIKKEMLEYEFADYITVPSMFAYNSFIEKGIKSSKLFYNPLGVQLSDFPFYPKEIQNTKLVIGYIGTMSAQKNVIGLINATENLFKQGLNIKLLLTGPIDHGSFDEATLKKPFIKYIKKQPQKELHKIYENIDVFVLNSIQEGLAMVQLQAMACGLPLISTTNSGGLDLISEGDNGFIIPAFDRRALEDRIEWFYNNKHQIPEMGRTSRKMVEAAFTWEQYGRRYVDFLNGFN